MGDDTKLPGEFSDLQELADRFAVSDDVERGFLADAASYEQRRELVDTVFPRLAAIDAHLDHHDDESAHLLGRLAEAALEVSFQIGRPAA
jgi:hypothetical protein